VTDQGLRLQQSDRSLILALKTSAPWQATVEDVSAPRAPQDSANPGVRRILVRLRTPANSKGLIAVTATPGR
jgi:hypothetical protein